MVEPRLTLTRRTLLASIAASGSAAFGAMAAWPRLAGAQDARAVTLRAAVGTRALRPGQPETAVATLATGTEGGLRGRRGETLAITLVNALPAAVALSLRGNGVAAAEPLLARPPLAPSQSFALGLPQRFAGTGWLDLRLLESAASGPMPALPLVVTELDPIAVDRDEVLLIEEFRLAPDGHALAPGAPATDAAAIFTLNGKPSFDLPTRSFQRLRIRFINGCQRAAIAIKIQDHDCRVIAIDGHPAEPFTARNGQLVLAPGTRVDAIVDALKPPGSTADILLHDGRAARPIGRLVYSAEPALRPTPAAPIPPLPSNGLPQRIELSSAQRFDLPLATPDWLRPAAMTPAIAPAFRAKAGRGVVLTLSNPSSLPMVFHLHGHPFRLLDRMDDGWKPYWLDTLLIGPQQTERIAFVAEQPGRWLIETMATDWSAPRLLRAYAVE